MHTCDVECINRGKGADVVLYLKLLFFLVFGYYVYHFIQIIFRMESKKIFPKSEDEILDLRKLPEKPLDYPSLKKQKVGILLYGGALLFVFIMYVLLFFFFDSENGFDWILYITLLLPFSYVDLLNLFAIFDDGILIGNKFVPWGRLKGYHFIPIDMNHRFYGYDRKVNSGYELEFKGKVFSYNCIVITDEMKVTLEKLLDSHIKRIPYENKNKLNSKEEVH